MTKSRIIGLMERKLTASLAADRLQLAGLLRQSADATRLAERLAGMLKERPVPVGQEVFAADFRLDRRLTAEIAVETTRQAERANQLQAQATAQREALARKDRKCDRLAEARRTALQDEAEARRTALQDEAEAREARMLASLPPLQGR